MSLIFIIIAIVVFLLVGLGAAPIGEVDALRLTAFGLVAFAAAHIAWPGSWGPGPRS